MTIRNALKMLKPYRKRMIVIIVLAIFISGISAITPFINRTMIDSGLLEGNISIVIQFVLLLISLQLAGQFIEYMQTKQEIIISNALDKRLKVEAFEHGLKLKPHYFKENGFYKTISDALYDISSIMQIASNSLLTVFVIICKCVGSMVGLLILDWRLSIFVIAIMPIKFFINGIIRKRAEKHSQQLMDDNKAYNSWITNIISGIVDIKLWNLRKQTITEYAEHVQTINDSSKRLSLLRAKSRLFIIGIEYALMNSMYILGAVLIVGNQLTFGGLIAFITFASYVLSPVNIILELRVIMKQITPSVEGLKRYYELEEENHADSMRKPDKVSTIEFRNVSVTFDNRNILKNFNLKLNRGDKIAIIGDNGSGKTTILNLLLRLCEPDDGEIYMDGIPISEYNIEDYRSKFSVVTQDIHLFKGTAKENITFDKNAYFALNKDSRLRFCTDVIESWENHFDTEVGSDGAKLSGGEKQKIALLRALQRKSDILILDEPTSNYDKESEDEFNRFLLENADYDFYFIITHRKDILPKMDKILTVSDGVARVSSAIG